MKYRIYSSTRVLRVGIKGIYGSSREKELQGSSGNDVAWSTCRVRWAGALKKLMKVTEEGYTSGGIYVTQSGVRVTVSSRGGSGTCAS